VVGVVGHHEEAVSEKAERLLDARERRFGVAFAPSPSPLILPSERL